MNPAEPRPGAASELQLARRPGVCVAGAVTLAGVALAGCDGVSPRPAIIETDSAGITVVSNDLGQLDATCVLADAPSVVIGAESESSEQQLYRVFGATRMADRTIALVNQGSQQVRFYD